MGRVADLVNKLPSGGLTVQEHHDLAALLDSMMSNIGTLAPWAQKSNQKYFRVAGETYDANSWHGAGYYQYSDSGSTLVTSIDNDGYKYRAGGLAPASSLITTDYYIISAQGTSPGHSIISASSDDVQHRGVFKAVRARGTLASPTVPLSGDSVLSFMGSIFDGVDTEGTAVVDFIVDGNVSSNNAPQRISFKTSTTTALNRVERLQIKSDGNIIINETGADADVRIEGDNDANLFTLDGGSDVIALGGAVDASYKLKVYGSVLLTGDILVDGTNIGITADTDLITMAANTLTIAGTVAATTVTGANVTIGADPGHTHTGASLGSIDISDDTNLAVTAPIVLTDDTLSLGALGANWDAGSYAITAAGLYIGGSNQELRFYEGANYVGFEAPALAADQIWVLPDADGSASDYLQTDGGGNLTWAAISAGATVDTRANILAVAATSGLMAYANDIERFYVADGTSWFQIVPNGAVADAEAPDMGYEKDSALTGYGDDYITDKTLSNVLLGGNARTENGAIRVDVTETPDTFEIYLRDMWQTIIYDLTVSDGDFRHTPVGESIYVWRGNSVLLGLSGRPVVNEYDVSMGAFPPPRVLNGGTF